MPQEDAIQETKELEGYESEFLVEHSDGSITIENLAWHGDEVIKFDDPAHHFIENGLVRT